MSRRSLLCASVLGAALASCARFAGEEQRPLPKEADCRKAYAPIIERINKIHKEEGLPAIAIAPNPPFGLHDDSRFRAQLGVVGNRPGSPAEVRFLGSEAQPAFFLSRQGSDAVTGKGAKLYNVEPPPQWSREKAVGVATRLLRLFVDDERFRQLKLRKAKFVYQFMQDDRYYLGEWFMEWVRTSSEGEEFPNDRAWLSLSEVAGLQVLGVEWTSTYEGRPSRLLDKDKAIRLAQRLSAKVAESVPIRGTYGKLSLEGQTSAELKIVNPNHILKMKIAYELCFRGDRRARLAWVVTFGAKRETRFEGESRPRSAEVDVWIDAETGELLGGTFR